MARTAPLVLALLAAGLAPACGIDTPGLLARSRAATEAGRHGEACRYLYTAIRRPELTGRRRQLALQSLLRCAHRTGRLAALQAEARARLTRHPGDPEARYVLGLAALLSAAGTSAEAARHLAEAERADPGDAELPYRLGLVHLATERPAAAAVVLARAVKRRPRWAAPRVALAKAWAELGDAARAREALTPLADCRPTLAEVQQASQLLATMARDADPIPPAARPKFDHAMKLLDKEFTAAAASALKKAREEFPHVATFALLHGLTMVRLSNYGAALTLLQEAARRNPQDPTAPLHLGAVLQELGRTAEAVAYFRAATRLDPVSRRAWRGLGEALLSLKRVSDALPALERAAALSGRDPKVLRSLGQALAAAGRLNEAIALLRDALARAPKDVATRFELAELLVRRYRAAEGDRAAEKIFREARDLLRQLVKDAPTHEAARTLLRRLTAGAEGKRPTPRKREEGE